MATKKQKQELIEILKFTPITVQLVIQGYGGESYAGKVDRNVYDFFKNNKFDIEEYAGDWDGEWSDRIPQELQPFPSGSPYECDGLWHASGAELSNLNSITLEDLAQGKTIWECSAGFNELEAEGVSVNETGGFDLDDLEVGEVVFNGGQGEKGCFFDAEFVLTAPFDPKKLTINYENCDGWYLISSVEYDGEDIDGSGGYSTTGKWSENKWIIIGDEEVYEAVPFEDRDEEELPTIQELEIDSEERKEEYKLTDWFTKDITPAHKGEYEVMLADAAWPFSGIARAEWTGRTWKQDGDKIKITQWRGLSENPNV